MQIDWQHTHAALWRPNQQRLKPVHRVDPIGLDELQGIERQARQLCANTERFLRGQPANNALLWGARGTGKSSLVKAVFNRYRHQGLRLIEVFKHDLKHLPDMVDALVEQPQRFIIYCDDFTFEANEHSYLVLKTILEGSIEAPPDNLLLYATSNRRHLVPESMADNQASKVVDGDLHHSDAVEDKLALSDRFGLWLSFYPFSQDQFLAAVDALFPDYPGDREQLHIQACRYALGRGTRSGRTAKQFYQWFYGQD